MQQTTRRVLASVRSLVTWDHGQNYPFNGCMAYLMERLGEDPRYDYWFFSVVTGETFTQTHRDGCAGIPGTLTYGLSQMAFGEDFARRAFDACGYDFDFVAAEEIRRDPAAQFERIAAYIDRGLPVIGKGFAGVEGAVESECGQDFCALCGYDRSRQSLLFLCGDLQRPIERRKLLEGTSALLFVGGKKPAPPIETLYRRAVEGIPACLTRPARNGVSYGRQAFVDWADSLTDGSLADVPPEALDVWDCHGVYLCIAGTNCYVGVWMTELYQICPALAGQPGLIALTERLRPLYEKQKRIFHALLELEGGFAVPPERLRDPQAMRPVADKIRAFVDCCDGIFRVFSET